MRLANVYVPYGAYWSTPFCRWQGSLSNTSSIELAARTAVRALGERKISPECLDGLFLGMTVPQRYGFYGAPWLAGLIGAPGITGPLVSQACATSARLLASGSSDVEAGQRRCVLAIACDRTSNGPHVYYPNPKGQGGRGDAEDPVWDSFSYDPWAKNAMLDTAENVAKEAGISRKDQEAIALLRGRQYQDALANGRAFQRRYMVPAEVPAGKKETLLVQEDEGAQPATAESLAKARPVREGGTVTSGTQTFPADGNAGLVLATREEAEKLSRDKSIVVRIVSIGEARVKKGFMPTAPVPAARQALERAGLEIADVKAVKTHNPFALNDVYLCRELGVAPEAVNRYGSPLVFGHPQAPTGLRAVIELVEELVLAGGGHGLFTGCAAGDSAMSVVVKVG